MEPGPEQRAGTFAGLLRQLRVTAGLTQEDLAAAATLSPRSISDLERGINKTARRETASLLADALRLTGPARAGFEAAARGISAASAVPAGGTAAATRTLPRDTGAFIGRESELQQLADAAASAGAAGGVVGIHAIGGMAGVGKTTFAIHAAHLLAPQFPDGQVFLQLHAHTPGQRPVEPAEALASLLLTAGIAASQIPPGLDERMSLWRDHLAGKRTLLVMDDAAGHEQVRPLLPGTAGCLVLVTSRRRLTALEDASAVSLDTLPPDEAAELLVRLASRPGLTTGDAAVREITQLCGYLPLAIGMLARQLHHHPAWTAGELASDLGAARQRLQLMQTENVSVAAAFDLSYQDLAADQQRLFRRLGLHPGADIDAYAAAALDAADLAATRARLDALYDQCLLTEPVRGRYRLHDLVREHAQTLAATDTAAEQDAAAGRLLGFYLHTAQAADRHLARRSRTAAAVAAPAHAPELARWSDAMSWMERERLNLHAAVGFARGHGRVGEALALPAAMHAFLRFQGHWDDALTLHHLALAVAQQAGDTRAAADTLTNLGDTQYATRNYPVAAASLTQALELYRSLGDRAGEASALYELSAVFYLTGEFPAAAASLASALGLYREAGDRLGQAAVLSRLGSAQLMTGEHAEAGANIRQALELYRGLGDRLGEADALNELAYMHSTTGDYPAAGLNHEKALGLYRELGDRLGEANALSDLSTVREKTGDYPAATASLTQARELYRGLGDRLGEANALSQLGVLHQAAGDHRDAAVDFEQALKLYRDLGDRAGEARILNSLAENSLDAAEPGDARSRFEQARVISAAIALPREEARALEGIGRCHVRSGEHGDGAAALRQAAEIYQRIGAPEADGALRLLDEIGG